MGVQIKFYTPIFLLCGKGGKGDMAKSKLYNTRQELIDVKTLEKIFMQVYKEIREEEQKEQKFSNLKNLMGQANIISQKIKKGEMQDPDLPKNFLELYEETKKITNLLVKKIAEQQKLKKFFNGNEIEQINYLFSFTSGEDNYSTMYNVPLSLKQASVDLKGNLIYDVERAVKDFKELQEKLNTHKIIKYTDRYFSFHQSNYRNVLIDTAGGPLSYFNRGVSFQAFISHMRIHESDRLDDFLKIFSADEKSNDKEIEEAYENLKNRYGPFYGAIPREKYQKQLWRTVSGGECARDAWKHWIKSRGDLSGLVLGDVDQMQIKAGRYYMNQIRLSSINNILETLRLLDKILTSNDKDAEECVHQMVIKFTEAAYQITENWIEQNIKLDSKNRAVYNMFQNIIKELKEGYGIKFRTFG